MGGFCHLWRGHRGHTSKVAEGNSLVCACIQRYLKEKSEKNKQEPMWTCDKLQRADLTYYIARGIREAINTQYEIDSLIAHI